MKEDGGQLTDDIYPMSLKLSISNHQSVIRGAAHTGFDNFA